MKAAATLCLVLLLSSCAEQVVPKLVHSSPDEAVVDLVQWDFRARGPVRLFGNTWEFYWKQLYTPEDFEPGSVTDQPILVRGGHAWNGTDVGGEALGPDGYATYRVVIRLPAGAEVYGLYMQNQDSAYRLWLNGEEAAGNGVVATSVDAYTPQRLPRLVDRHIEGDRLEIVMQVANFTHKWGGLTNNIYLGPAAQIRGYVDRLYGIINFLAGAILIVAAYHLILYLVVRRELSALFFSLFCFFVFFLYLFNGEYLLFRMIPSFPLGLGIRLHYAFICGMLPFFLLFIDSAYPDKSLRTPLRVFAGAGFALTAVPAVAPIPLFSSRILVPYYVLVVIAAVVVFAVLIRALIRRQPGALFALTGFAVFIGTAGYDMLADQKLIVGSAMGPFLPAGLFVFILFQSVILARQFSVAYARLDHLSANLEEEVRRRTDELQNAREHAYQQERLAALGTLAAGVSHEILNPLSGISGPLENIRKELETAGFGKKAELVRPLSHIEDNVDRIAATVKNLDALMKDRQMVKTSVRLFSVAQRVADRYPETHMVIEVDERAQVTGDEGVLRQILENLVSNAVHALDEAGGVTIRYESTPAPGRILVEDTGLGMGDAEVSRAFDPFYTTREHAGGSGLGLFLTRRLAESLGWHIRLSSVPGAGTVVTIILS